MSVQGIANRIPRDIADAPDLTGGLCIGRGGDWDLDVLAGNPGGVRRAERACLFDCPVLRDCHRWTHSLAKHPATRPRSVVQAGQAWGKVATRKAKAVARP